MKRVVEHKNHAVKKLQRIHDEKHTMCEWDHWNNIGANPVQYRGEFAMSKTPRIRVVCLIALKFVLDEQPTVYGQMFMEDKVFSPKKLKMVGAWTDGLIPN